MGELVKFDTGTGEIVNYDDAKRQYQRIETYKQAILTYQKLGGDISEIIPPAIDILWDEVALGRFLRVMEKNKGAAEKDWQNAVESDDRVPKVEEIVGSKDKSSLLQRISKFTNETIQDYIDLCIENNSLPKSGDLKNMANLKSKMTGDNEWYTPAIYIEKVRRVLGCIDLDPASSEFAQNIVKAKKYYTIETNGLDKDWKGNVFMNPPFGRAEINLFINKWVEEIKNKNIKSTILLTNNFTDTSWFHNAAVISKLLCFTRGRVNFYKQEDTKSGSTNGQLFYYYGDNLKGFQDEFNDVGLIVSVYV
jgi:phage N-6-adenine-methyltransferase